MKGISVFDFSESKPFIRAWITARPRRGHGEKSRIASAIGCHSAYISQVLEHDAQLSPEQLLALADHMGLGVQESRFFLLLLQRERAGTRALRKLVEGQIQEVLEARTLLRNRLETQRVLDAAAQATYYSSWHYAAVHMAISLPLLNTKQALGQRLAVPLPRIGEILAFLVEAGLAVEEGGQFRPGTASLYLPENSPLISKHHANWRLKALHALDDPRLHDLHYTSVATLSEKDLPAVRAILIKAIEEIRSVIRGSTHEDTVFAYNFDLFRV